MQYGNALRVVPDQAGFLADLNAPQKTAVLTIEGPVLVLAGAGTGKTRVLTSRVAYILAQGLTAPDGLLAVTFTNKAAFEMRQRISALTNLPVDNTMWVGTFHSISMRILRAHAERLDLDAQFSILDDDDQLRLIKNIIKVFEADDKMYPAKVLLNHIRRWKDRGLFPHQLGLAMGPVETMARRAYREYQERLKVLKALDFGDLLLYCIKLFDEHPDILASYQEKFRYILVDEYQDTNSAQYLWLKHLASGHGNICCVGDDDQAIYSWRGAEIGNILRFEKEFKDAKIVRLEQNYRSRGHILKAASALISHNTKRLGKKLWTQTTDGNLIQIKHAWNSEDEARFVGNELERLRARDVPLDSVAVLVRASFQTREFEDRFLKQGIPYRVVGGLRFYERQEIRDALAYIRFLINPDDSFAFERIINVPKRSIGEATIHKAHVIAQEEGISLSAAALQYAVNVRGKASQAIKSFLEVIAQGRELLRDTPPATVVKTVLENAGYVAMWKQEKTAEALVRLENLKELINAIAEFDNLSDFIDYVSLMIDRVDPDTPNMVSLMTIHGAKGLEFNTVFLVGWEEGLFPNQRTLVETGVAGLEEERRLAYVAMTRAQENLYISYCSHRKTNSAGWQMAVPSRFVRELPQDSVVFLDKKGVSVRGDGSEPSRDISEEQSTTAIKGKYKFM